MGKAVPCSTMYLLDCRMPMHCQSLKERPDCSLFTCAVAFLQSVLKEHVIKGHNEFGLILWGTQENSNSLGSTAGIVEWLPLSRPTCARIIQLGKLAATGLFCGASKDVPRSLSAGADSPQVHQHYSAASATLPGSVCAVVVGLCRHAALCRLRRAGVERGGAELQHERRAVVRAQGVRQEQRARWQQEDCGHHVRPVPLRPYD